MQLFVVIKNVGIKINGDVNVKNWLAKIYVMMHLVGILGYGNVNVVNLVILENI